jgi:hypothetical protein
MSGARKEAIWPPMNADKTGLFDSRAVGYFGFPQA